MIAACPNVANMRQSHNVVYLQLSLDVVYLRHYIKVVNIRLLAIAGTMKINRPADLAALVREARQQKGWTQVELAKRLEVHRDWVLRLENGEPGVALGGVLRALRELGFELQVSSSNTEENNKPMQPKRSGAPISIDEVVDE